MSEEAVTKTRGAQRTMTRKLLERQLHVLKPGDPLPPIRTLMKTCNTSRARLGVVLDEFQSNGLVDRIPRQGIFKTASNAKSSLIQFVELIGCGVVTDALKQGTFQAELVEAFAIAVGQRHQGLRHHQISVEEPISRYESLAGRSDVRACVLLGLHTREVAKIFDAHCVPYVSLFPQTSADHPRCIADSPHMVELQLNHLWELGHRRIAMLDPVEPVAPLWVHFSRRESYYRLMAQKGFRIEPNWMVYGGHNDATVMKAFTEMFSKEPYPTAVIVGDTQLPGAYRYVEGRGLRVGKDVSIISTDDLAFAASMHPPVTSVRNSRKNAARMALKLLDKVINGEEIEPVHEVNLELMVRESTGPPPAQ